MKHNGLYDDIKEMLAGEDFQMDFAIQDDMLADLRDAIKNAETPQWITDALTEMHATFPAGQSLRYRSSASNEDLPGFSGAGLYDSKTQHPDETAEDGIAKSLKQVYASLWNFRAFTEREFHRIDHLAAAMGMLVHLNYSDELASGVAVSFAPPLRPLRILLRQHAARRGSGDQSRRPLGAGGNPVASERLPCRPGDLQPGAAERPSMAAR